MKKVTTNITFGQILFILFILLFASLIFFYLGARFGPGLINLGKSKYALDEPILPDEKMAQEIKEMLGQKKHEFVFYEALQSKAELKSLTPQKSEEYGLNADSFIPKEIFEQIKKEMELEAREEKNKKLIVANEVLPKKSEVLKPKNEPKNTTADKPPLKESLAKIPEPLNVKTADPVVINTVDADQNRVSYSLQMGSYSKKQKALSAQAVWQNRGYSVEVIPFNNKDKGEWYRLRLGGYSSMDDAVKARNMVMQKFRQSASIVSLK